MILYGWGAAGIVAAIFVGVALFAGLIWAWCAFADRVGFGGLWQVAVPMAAVAVGVAIVVSINGVAL